MRGLLRRSVIDGRIRLAFTREPTYTRGEGLAGSQDSSVVALEQGEVCAMGRCSVQPLMRNGLPARIAYLGELRADPGVPGTARFLRDGYAALATAAKDAGAEGFVTAIADDNTRARRVLERGGRLGLPRYTPLAPLETLILPVPPQGRGREDGAAAEPREEVTDFLQVRAEARHLSLAWDAARWDALVGHDVRPEDLCVVREQGRIIAAGIVWDQRAFRQTVVMGYDAMLTALRPVVNAAAMVRRAPRLPAPRTVLAQGTLLAASASDASGWMRLLPRLRDRAAARGLSWIALTLDRRDPAVGLLRRLTRARRYPTTLYEVSFPGIPGFRSPWDSRLMGPEAGLL